jgi:hypothetical protein
MARESAVLEYKEMHVFVLQHNLWKSTIGMTMFIPSSKSLFTPLDFLECNET